VTLWQPAAKKNSGWVSQFGELKGLKNLKSRKIADVTPYVVARTDRYEKEAGNPFKQSGKKSQLTGGIDGKLGLTNNLTLDFTINPDFGQVEADPSEVNLTSYETFFLEKRPFFIEGNIRVALARVLITVRRSVQTNISMQLNLQKFWEQLKSQGRQRRDGRSDCLKASPVKSLHTSATGHSAQK
jgi:hypothetical protein